MASNKPPTKPPTKPPIKPPPPTKNLQDEASKSLAKLSSNIKMSLFTKQLLGGAVSGWLTGSIVRKVGKPAAFVAGGSIILLEIAHHNGYISWDLEKTLKNPKIPNATTPNAKTQNLVNEVRNFAGKNKVFATGFLGGFLIGLST